jgi:hypothetical protein
MLLLLLLPLPLLPLAAPPNAAAAAAAPAPAATAADTSGGGSSTVHSFSTHRACGSSHGSQQRSVSRLLRVDDFHPASTAQQSRLELMRRMYVAAHHRPLHRNPNQYIPPIAAAASRSQHADMSYAARK